MQITYLARTRIPQMPHQFYGDVTIDGVAAPRTFIRARIGGSAYMSEYASDGSYGWSGGFLVPADDPDTIAVEGGVDGDIIAFYVGDTWAANYTFNSGSITELPLERARALDKKERDNVYQWIRREKKKGKDAGIIGCYGGEYLVWHEDFQASIRSENR